MMSDDVYLSVDRERADQSQLHSFMRRLRESGGPDFEDYPSLHAWACANYKAFWQLFLEFLQLPASGAPSPVVDGDSVQSARFFPALRINFAECVLRDLPGVSRDAPAIIFRDEEGGRMVRSRAQVADRVMRIAAALQSSSVGPGDRVAAIARNSSEAIEACIGTAAIGAIWSSVAPDLGTEAVVSRFLQFEPVVLMAHARFRHHGVERNLVARIQAVVDQIPSIRLVVILEGESPTRLREGVQMVSLERWLERPGLDPALLDRFPFNHPLYILFSSGTTGAPKCLVHGAGGTLLEHLKEHRLHSDFRPDDLLYFHTSCGWMMWNWQLSALASGMPIMVFDGSVSYPDSTALLRVLEDEGVTVFGTSPAYIQLLKDSGIEPRSVGRFDALRAVQSTGSILYDAHFDWIGEHLGGVAVQSISGGTDIVGCFVLGNPMMSIYRGESQCVSLGLDVRVADEGGVSRFGTGELVCVNPFPSRPVGIWGDTDCRKFHENYFAQNPGVWTHGDRIQLKERGSARILGRSDGIMKIRGVRIGPAEIYTVVLALPGVLEAMAVEQMAPDEPGGSRIVLLLVLAPGLTLDRPRVLSIKREISERASPAHVPSVVAQVSGLPQTHNGKYSEKAAREAVNGRRPVNLSALKNPETLDEICRIEPLAVPASGERSQASGAERHRVGSADRSRSS